MHCSISDITATSKLCVLIAIDSSQKEVFLCEGLVYEN